MRDVAIDTRVISAPADYRPKHKAHLQNIQSKDPVELENGGYVSQWFLNSQIYKYLLNLNLQ